MIDFAAARRIAELYVLELPRNSEPGFSIQHELTITKKFGWVFFYNSTEFPEGNEMNNALAGNAPFIVDKISGDITPTGTALPVEQYIQDYERDR